MLTYTTVKNVPGYEQFKKNLTNLPIERLQLNIKKLDDFLNSNKKFFVSHKKDARMNRDCVKEYKNMFTEAIESRFPQCVKENETRFVSKKLHKNLLTKPKNVSKLTTSNETNNTNSKGDKTMENKINELLTLVKHLTARIESLETGNRPQIKKLRERKEEAPKSEKKAIAKKVAAPTDKGEILKLQKKVREGEKTLTKKQLTQYNFFYGQEWRKINKTIDLNDKLARSMAFTKARLNCLKKAKTF